MTSLQTLHQWLFRDLWSPPCDHWETQSWSARCASGASPLNWCLYLLNLFLCASWLSISLILVSNSQAEAPQCLLQRLIIGFHPSASEWLQEAGLFCAEPPHFHQRPAEAGRPAVWSRNMYVRVCLNQNGMICIYAAWSPVESNLIWANDSPSNYHETPTVVLDLFGYNK